MRYSLQAYVSQMLPLFPPTLPLMFARGRLHLKTRLQLLLLACKSHELSTVPSDAKDHDVMSHPLLTGWRLPSCGLAHNFTEPNVTPSTWTIDVELKTLPLVILLRNPKCNNPPTASPSLNLPPWFVRVRLVTSHVVSNYLDGFSFRNINLVFCSYRCKNTRDFTVCNS